MYGFSSFLMFGFIKKILINLMASHVYARNKTGFNAKNTRAKIFIPIPIAMAIFYNTYAIWLHLLEQN